MYSITGYLKNFGLFSPKSFGFSGSKADSMDFRAESELFKNVLLVKNGGAGYCYTIYDHYHKKGLNNAKQAPLLSSTNPWETHGINGTSMEL